MTKPAQRIGIVFQRPKRHSGSNGRGRERSKILKISTDTRGLEMGLIQSTSNAAPVGRGMSSFISGKAVANRSDFLRHLKKLRPGKRALGGVGPDKERGTATQGPCVSCVCLVRSQTRPNNRRPNKAKQGQQWDQEIPGRGLGGGCLWVSYQPVAYRSLHFRGTPPMGSPTSVSSTKWQPGGFARSKHGDLGAGWGGGS